jgi:hypothetical protein
MVERQLPKLDTRVRFPSPAPIVAFQRLVIQHSTPERPSGKISGKTSSEIRLRLRMCFELGDYLLDESKQHRDISR